MVIQNCHHLHERTLRIPGWRGSRVAIHFRKMSFMEQGDFQKGSPNQHFQSTLLVGKEWVTKEYSVYALDNCDNSGRPCKVITRDS